MIGTESPRGDYVRWVLATVAGLGLASCQAGLVPAARGDHEVAFRTGGVATGPSTMPHPTAASTPTTSPPSAPPSAPPTLWFKSHAQLVLGRRLPPESTVWRSQAEKDAFDRRFPLDPSRPIETGSIPPIDFVAYDAVVVVLRVLDDLHGLVEVRALELSGDAVKVRSVISYGVDAPTHMAYFMFAHIVLVEKRAATYEFLPPETVFRR